MTNHSEILSPNSFRQIIWDNDCLTIFGWQFEVSIFHEYSIDGLNVRTESSRPRHMGSSPTADCPNWQEIQTVVSPLTAKSAHMGSSFTAPVPVHLLPKWQFSYCQGDSLKKSPGKFYFFLKLSSNMIGFCNICKALTALSLKYKNPLSHTVASFWTADWQIGSEWTAHCHLAVGELRMWRGLQESWFRCDSMWL